MLLNCAVGEDSWESLGLQGDQTRQSKRKSTSKYALEGVILKLQPFGPLMQRADSLEKTLMLANIEGGKRRGWQDEMVGWHHWRNEHKFEQTPGDSEGQRSLVCCSRWGHKESDTTEWLNNNKSWSWREKGPPFQPTSDVSLACFREIDHWSHDMCTSRKVGGMALCLHILGTEIRGARSVSLPKGVRYFQEVRPFLCTTPSVRGHLKASLTVPTPPSPEGLTWRSRALVRVSLSTAAKFTDPELCKVMVITTLLLWFFPLCHWTWMKACGPQPRPSLGYRWINRSCPLFFLSPLFYAKVMLNCCHLLSWPP